MIVVGQNNATGKVVKAIGNLVHVEFKGVIEQGEVAYIKTSSGVCLKSEIIEINNNSVKIQVFESTEGIRYGDDVIFSGEPLSVELAPGLLGQTFDGLQNALKTLEQETGAFLERGVYPDPLSREKKWIFKPSVEVGQILNKGDAVGFVQEGIESHQISVPLYVKGNVTIERIINSSDPLSIEDTVATIKDNETQKVIELNMITKWPVKTRMRKGIKIDPSEQLVTGVRVIDTLFPIMKGGTFCTPGPFGAGKTILQHHFSRRSNVDIVIIVACGERAGEIVQIVEDLAHLEDVKTGSKLMDRTILICNTSSMPVASRETSVYTGITIAEYYMNMGKDVLVLADSTSRWAQAMRELSGRLEEIPSEEAFPAYLGSRIAQFYERSGKFVFGDGGSGSITIGGTVSPSGGNFDEPVTQKTLSVVGGFLALSRERASARKFPAIDPLISWSKYLDDCFRIEKSEVKEEIVKTVIDILKRGNEVEQRLEVVGEDGVAINEFIIYLMADLFDFVFLQQNAFNDEDQYTAISKQDSLLSIINQVFTKKFNFEDTKSARKFFSHIRNKINNLTYLSESSEEYKEEIRLISEQINRG